MLINDITTQVHLSDQFELKGLATPETETAPITGNIKLTPSFTDPVIGHEDVNNIMVAIEKGQFCLFCQLITPLRGSLEQSEHFEILVRLMEEEDSMIPPGAFFPLAEKYGLMLHLDRWVVQHITEFASRHNSLTEVWEGSMFFINLSMTTIADPAFPEFLKLTLTEYNVPGGALCFEIPDKELSAKTAVIAEFTKRIRQYGCRVAVSGFGLEHTLFDLVRICQPEFLKIDGTLILDILRDSDSLAKLNAINHEAKKLGIETVAELVEDDVTIASLKEIGIDYAQGFGISRPRPLTD
jgi:EAL domain-containing protein (putative c-di-GMP-specific phosphodiesterase class I)